MTILARTATFVLLLWTSALNAQWMHVGLDGIIGIHYNTLDAPSYKNPIGDAAFGMHVTWSDPDDFRRIYFNGRLTFGNDFQTYPLFPGTNLDCALRDLVCSIQSCKKLNEKCTVYAGLNLSFNVINTIWLRSGGNIFFNSGQRTEVVEATVRQKVQRFNAGIETGFTYSLGKGFNTGLHLTYYVLNRLNDGLALGPLGGPENVSLNFRPLALKMLCTLDLH